LLQPQQMGQLCNCREQRIARVFALQEPTACGYFWYSW